MWVGEISGTLSIVKMAERRGSPSTPAPLQYLSQKAPLEAYEEGWRTQCDGVVGGLREEVWVRSWPRERRAVA